jgi:hypothetical protein
MITVTKKKPAKVTTTIPCIKPLLKKWFLPFQKNIQGYHSHFLCARVTVFSGARQQNFAGAGQCTGATFDLKNVPTKFIMQSCKFFPPRWRRQW